MLRLHRIGTSSASIGSVPDEVSAEVWVAAFRRAVAAQRPGLRRPRRESRRAASTTAIGEGGDRTLVIDRLCEDAVFAELEAAPRPGRTSSRPISEERGTVTFGDPAAPTRVVIDPIDGSLNARRTIPCTASASPSPRASRWPTSASATSTSSARARSSSPLAAAAPSSTARPSRRQRGRRPRAGGDGGEQARAR